MNCFNTAGVSPSPTGRLPTCTRRVFLVICMSVPRFTAGDSGMPVPAARPGMPAMMSDAGGT